MSKKLTIKDLNKADLIECIEAAPSFNALFTEDIIAGLIVFRNAKEINKIRKRLDVLRKEEKETRGLKRLIPIRRKMNTLAVRGNKLINQAKELQERFPDLKGDESC